MTTHYVLQAAPGHFNFTGAAFMVYARKYREAAVAWLKQRSRDNRFDPISYQLLCQALELHLKSFIWLKDKIGREQIKKKYGHDLNKLWRHAKARRLDQFVRPTGPRNRVITLVSPYYKKRQFTYVDLDMVFEGFRALDREPKAISVLLLLTKRLGESLRNSILAAS